MGKKEQTKKKLIAMLSREQKRYKTIFRESSKKMGVYGTDEFWEAKKKFDDADRKIKDLDKEIADLITNPKHYDPKVWEDLEFYWKKITGGDDVPSDWVQHKPAPDGIQSQPSQTKVKL